MFHSYDKLPEKCWWIRNSFGVGQHVEIVSVTCWQVCSHMSCLNTRGGKCISYIASWRSFNMWRFPKIWVPPVIPNHNRMVYSWVFPCFIMNLYRIFHGINHLSSPLESTPEIRSTAPTWRAGWSNPPRSATCSWAGSRARWRRAERRCWNPRAPRQDGGKIGTRKAP